MSVGLLVQALALHATSTLRPRQLANRRFPQPAATVAAAKAGWLAGTVLVGASGALVVVPNLEPWYQDIVKPSWAPPNNVFAPVWTTLYLLLGAAAAATFGAAPLAQPRALTAFAGQAVLNVLWAPVFFGMHALGAAFYVSIALLLAALATAVEMGRAAGLATGALLVPYVVWLTYATVLNWRLWRLNPKAA